MTIDPASLGFVQPTADDWISDGDDAITQNAAATVALYERATAESEARVGEVSKWLEPSPNLLNPDEFEIDMFLGSYSMGGKPVPLPGYTTSGFIRVTPGAIYTTTARAWNAYTEDRALVLFTNTNAEHATIQIEIPSDTPWIRLAWATSQTATMQLEKGNTATPWQPYGVKIPALKTDTADRTTPVTLTVDPSTQTIAIESELGGLPIYVEGGPGLRPDSGVYNIGGTWFNGVNTHIAGQPDEIAPIRTEAGTVGANHGFAYFQNWQTHDKTNADLGSVWTDGTREWTLVAITPAGRAHFAPDPVIPSTGEATIPTTLSGDMVHISGATNTATLPQSGANRGADQVRPAVTRHHLAYYVDGIRVTEGSRAGVTVEVRESYEIIDYVSLLAVARAHPGEPYWTHPVAGTVRIGLTYRYTGGCACEVRTELTELTPSRLAQNGFVQATALGGATVTRTVPGAVGWESPVDLATHSTNVLIEPEDLIDPRVPPVMSIDDNGTLAFALGYRPWAEGAASSPARIGADLIRYWDLRATDKSYPIALMSMPPGWGRLTAVAYRVYMTPDDAAGVIAEASDAHAADAALASFVSI